MRKLYYALDNILHLCSIIMSMLLYRKCIKELRMKDISRIDYLMIYLNYLKSGQYKV